MRTDAGVRLFRDYGLSEILAWLYETHGFDFRNYRAPTLERRISRRLYLTGAKSYGEYLARLKETPAELTHLLEDLTIKVSRFFRDAPMFERLARDVLPTLLSGRGRGGTRSFRAWCAGCANGEEVYSLAILVEEMIRRRARLRVMIHGTDLDDKAVRAARAGLYAESVLGEIPHGHLKAYFERAGDDYAVREAVRRHVHFSRYDLTSRRSLSPPGGVFADYDLIFCRNVLIYYDLSLQERIVSKFTKVLAPGGVLVLGTAEHIPRPVAPMFEAVSRRWKIFRRLSDVPPPPVFREALGR
ncbi:MAG: hypothetical protein A2V83_01595 [Nitrospirae bacterium RBG_16_64_22]|nr:MAG: hypothetical protein A2V83_01595 [Nitrospirae bacterium RBG_16_64_22]